MSKTIEKQYEGHIVLKQKNGLTKLGVEKNASWYTDPRRLGFVLSRYKFVAKMLSGKQNVLEIGCGDAFPVRIVLQEVKSVHAVDIDPEFIRDAEERMDPKWLFSCAVHDMVAEPVQGVFDAAYTLDVLEHISKANERNFIENIVQSLISDGVLYSGPRFLDSGLRC